MAGLPISATAALINAVIVSLLARFRADALPISVVSGALVGGLWVQTVLAQGTSTDASETGTITLQGFFPFGAIGALMGVLYWLIAILPQRRRRLARKSVSALDQAAQDALKRKRDRRIPWDGRVPPD
jgi:hypothetical protein